jgi:hypothetical protein
MRIWSVLGTREHWMIYWGPGFLGVVWFGSYPTPTPLCHVQDVYFSQSSCESPIELTDGRRGRGVKLGRGQIIRRQGSLTFCNSFNTLCLVHNSEVKQMASISYHWKKRCCLKGTHEMAKKYALIAYKFSKYNLLSWFCSVNFIFLLWIYLLISWMLAAPSLAFTG